MGLDKKNVAELESAVLQRLIKHLRDKPEVQNIDLMNLAGFCRNCLSNWMEDAAKEKGFQLTRDEARQHVYGMPYDEWKALYQKPADPKQAAQFEQSNRNKH